MNITVYLGANPGSDPALERAARELGGWIGESGHALVYGGSKSGLMGLLAESVLRAGGEVTGVEPRFFVDAGFVYDAITRLIVTEDMAQRKARMIELGDAFIAFPGGTGTLEEIAEVMSKVSLGHLDAPCILYNLNGYYDGLKAQLAHMIEMGLSSPEKQAGICFADSLDGIREILRTSDSHRRENGTMKQTIRVNEYANQIVSALPKGVLLNTNGDKFNAMVIGWGHLGTLWSRPTFHVYVRQGRYTKGQLDRTGEFTVSIPLDGVDPVINRVCGGQSGFNIDKVREAGLALEDARTTGTPGVRQYPLTLECRVLYAQDQDLSRIPEDIRARMYPQDVPGTAPLANRDCHTMYVGEIVDAYIIG